MFYKPLHAYTYSLTLPTPPKSLDCVRFVFIRQGAAQICGDCGVRPVAAGDLMLIGPGVLLCMLPCPEVTYSVITLDTDYVIDQLFWQHAEKLSDRHEALDLAASLYPEPFQVLKLGRQALLSINPWLDELAALSKSENYQERFNRVQALWFDIADFIAPYVPIANHPAMQLAEGPSRFSISAVRRFAPIRAEVQAAVYLMRNDPARRWTVTELAVAVHLSRSQLSAVFVQALGMSPMAFLARIRVERMAGYLRETELPIEAILRLVVLG